MKIFAKSVVGCILLTAAMGCRTIKNASGLPANFFAERYADSVYLEVKGDLYDPVIIYGNIEIYLRAFRRMESHLKFEDNAFKWDYKTAKDLKISENIFNYVTECYEILNSRLKNGTGKIKFKKDGQWYIINER